MRLVAITPKMFDFMTSGLIDGLKQSGCELVSNENSNSLNSSTVNDIQQEARDGTLFVYFISATTEPPENFQFLRGKQYVLVDGSDYSDFESISHVTTMLGKPIAIFKRELLASSAVKNDFIHPLNFCVSLHDFSRLKHLHDKSLLLSYMANTRSNPLRSTIENVLKTVESDYIKVGKTGECSYNWNISVPIETPSYDLTLLSSLCSISVPGLGYDCQRYWEIPLAHTALIAWEHDLIIPNDFVNGYDCIKVSSLDELMITIRSISSDINKYVDIANRGFETLMKHHTSLQRAQFFLSVVTERVSK